jgi:hypothetical protein
VASQTSGPNALFNKAAALIQNGFYSGSISNILSQSTAGDSLVVTTNPSPRRLVYPQAALLDPAYDIAELKLRAAIRIPLTFTYGQKPPVILVPGTGSTGYITYAGNYIKLLSNVDYADPVWLNIPDFLLDDAQSNAVS